MLCFSADLKLGHLGFHHPSITAERPTFAYLGFRIVDPDRNTMVDCTKMRIHCLNKLLLYGRFGVLQRKQPVKVDRASQWSIL